MSRWKTRPILPLKRASQLLQSLTRSGIALEVSFSIVDDGKAKEVRDLQLRGDARLIYRAAFTPETIEGFDPEFFRNPAEKVLSAE